MVRRLDIKDFNFMNHILTHPSILPAITDDGWLDENRIIAGEHYLESDQIYVLSTGRNNVFIFEPLNAVTYEAHIHCLPAGRKQAAFDASIEVIKWMFKNTNCLKINAITPEIMEYMTRFVSNLRFRREGLSRKSFLKNSVLTNEIYWGLTKEEFYNGVS